MNRNFSFETPIMVYETKGLRNKANCLGFCKTYKEAQEEIQKRGGDYLKYGIDNAINAHFFDRGIFDENKINECIKKAYNYI